MPASGKSAPRRVVVASASPDVVNTNAYLRSYVAAGFRQALPEAEVHNVAYEGMTAAIRSLKPDLTVVFGSILPDECDYVRAREAVDALGARMVFWLHDDPYEFDANYRVYPLADALFTNDSTALMHLPPHVRAFHLPLGGCAVTHYREVGIRSQPDWFFCGYAYGNRQQFAERVQALVPQARGMVVGAGWDQGRLPIAAEMRLSNDALSDFYAAAKAVLNMGRAHDLANARYQLRAATPGPRTFEAAMAGAAQVYVLDSMEILDNFVPDEEILLADGPEDFAEHLARLMADPVLSARIGRAAQQRALRDHSYRARAERMLACLEGQEGSLSP